MIQQRYGALVKAAISVAIIWILLSHVDLAPVGTRLRRLGPIEVLLVIAPLALQMILATERWRLICRVLGVFLRFVFTLRVVVIGAFFNQTLPSSVGGDAMRIWLLAREGVRIGKAVTTVLSDRVLGLLILLGIAAATLPLFYDRVADSAARLAITVLAVGGLGGFVVFLACGAWLAVLLRRWKFSRPLGDLAGDFHRLFTLSMHTGILVALSATIHLLTVATAWLIARLLAINVDLADCVIIIPPVLLITMLPISIAGWGVREGAMVLGLGLVGVSSADALAVSICFGLANIVIALPGGVLWLRGRHHQTSASGA